MNSVKQLEVDSISSEWDLLRLAVDLKGLRRERQHLARKSQERDLTEWEYRRLRAVEKEACDCLMKIVNAKNPFSTSNNT